MSEQSISNLPMPTGFFITLEGLEGAGKSTQGNLLLEWFQSLGMDAILVREPGGTDLGADIRQMFFKHHDTICGEAEIGLLLAAKVELLEKVIGPALMENKVVICDRYTDTLYAYQHGAKGHPVETIDRMIAGFGITLRPDFTIYFYISPEESVQRANERAANGGETNNLDERPLHFHQLIHDGFRKRFSEKSGSEFAVVPGSGLTPEEILHQCVIPRVEAAMRMQSIVMSVPEDDIPEC